MVNADETCKSNEAVYGAMVRFFKTNTGSILHTVCWRNKTNVREKSLYSGHFECLSLSKWRYYIDPTNPTDVLLDTARRRVLVGDKNVNLTRKEYDRLLYFIKNSSCVLTFEQIYNAVWHEEYLMDNSTIFYYVGNLRKKIKVDWIESVYDVFYFNGIILFPVYPQKNL